MACIQVRGFNHYYEWITATGTSEPTGKPVMVFQHGWGGSARYWESTARAIADQFDCLLYDMRGFGRSQQSTSGVTESPELVASAMTDPLSYELDSYAEDLAGLLDALGIQRIYLNAHSMGASVAVFFLNLFPERVERAILTCNGIFNTTKKPLMPSTSSAVMSSNFVRVGYIVCLTWIGCLCNAFSTDPYLAILVGHF